MSRLAASPIPEFIETMLPRNLSRYRIAVADQEMAVMETGSGRDVLLVHGNPTWGFLYRKVCQALAGEPFRLICPDLVGFGLSSKPKSAGAHTLAAHEAWMSELIETLDLRDAILVVQDWGGPIGLLGAAAHPDRFVGKVILNTVVGPPKVGFKPTAFHRFANMPLISDFAFRGLGFPQRRLSMAQGNKESIRGVVSRAYQWPLQSFRNRVAPLATARMVPNSQKHPSIEPLTRCREYVESSDGPVSIVWGDRDPILGRAVHRLKRLLPNAEVTRTEAGHFLQEEVPDEIADAIRRVNEQL